jgi:hypothetical protein
LIDFSARRYCSPGTPSFEFLIWLAEAEMTRVRMGAPAPLRVSFADTTPVPSAASSRSRAAADWLDRVWRPLLPMLGAVEDPAITADDTTPFLSFDHMFNAMVGAAERGEPVPRLQAPEAARQTVRSMIDKCVGSAPVVITLREAAYDTHRNSNLREWLRFAAGLDAGVIFVRDTAKAHEPLDGFPTYPHASTDVQVRMALYEQARMNFFVSNGPWMMAGLSHAPYRYFMTQYANSHGHGPQYPWAGPDQRIVYALDRFENLTAVWRQPEKSCQ